MKIYVAPGHGVTPSGGFDPGAVSGHEVEHTLAHAVVAAYAAALRRNGITVVAETEPDPDYIGSVSRANAAGVDCGDEVHFNAGGGHGVEVEVHPATTAANRACAARMCQLVSEATGMPNRGPVDRTGLYWLNATRFPALLPEIAFVDADSAFIDQPGFAGKVGEALCRARCEYAGVAYHAPGSAPPPAPAQGVEVLDPFFSCTAYASLRIAWGVSPTAIEGETRYRIQIVAPDGSLAADDSSTDNHYQVDGLPMGGYKVRLAVGATGDLAASPWGPYHTVTVTQSS